MVNTYNNIGKDLLTLYESYPKAIEIIFNYGLMNGPFNTTDKNGNNILHLVTKNNDEKTLVAILNYIQLTKRHLNLINEQNNDLETPMHIAVQNRNEKIAEKLDNAGADLTIKNKNGQSIKTSDETPFSPQKQTSFLHQNTSESSLNLTGLDDSDYTSKFNKINVVESPSSISASEQFVAQLADEIAKIRSKLIMTKKINFLRGGADEEHDKDLSSTFEVKYMSDELQGGAKKVKDKNASRSSSSESSAIHDKVVQIFKDRGFENEDDARAMKAALYAKIKKENPTMNNLDRANQMMKEIENPANIAELKKQMEKYKEIIAEARKKKAGQEKTVKHEKPVKHEKTVDVETKPKKSTKKASKE